tara:strand:- start:17504 stop:17743 length:240 start_codon:yes stop_codon:yes gene_type:complete
MTEISIDTIAYVEEEGKWAHVIATFEDDRLFALCVPMIEKYIDKYYNEDAQRADQYILTESCGLGITIPDVEEFENEDS